MYRENNDCEMMRTELASALSFYKNSLEIPSQHAEVSFRNKPTKVSNQKSKNVKMNDGGYLSQNELRK